MLLLKKNGTRDMPPASRNKYIYLDHEMRGCSCPKMRADQKDGFVVLFLFFRAMRSGTLFFKDIEDPARS